LASKKADEQDADSVQEEEGNTAAAPIASELSVSCVVSAVQLGLMTRRPTAHSRLARLPFAFLLLERKSASCSIGFSNLNSPAQDTSVYASSGHLAMSPARLEARMDSLLSFPVE